MQSVDELLLEGKITEQTAARLKENAAKIQRVRAENPHSNQNIKSEISELKTDLSETQAALLSVGEGKPLSAAVKTAMLQKLEAAGANTFNFDERELL